MKYERHLYAYNSRLRAAQGLNERAESLIESGVTISVNYKEMLIHVVDGDTKYRESHEHFSHTDDFMKICGMEFKNVRFDRNSTFSGETIMYILSRWRNP